MFLAEAVTLAHVARPAVLARCLDVNQFEVFFASADRYSSLLRDLPVPVTTIHSISTDDFQRALAGGRPLHDLTTLRSYVEEDLTLLRGIQPDIVVGDLRHSLAVSARLAGVPYISVTNAYWSPYAHQQFSVPEIPLTRLLGVPFANVLFRLARRSAFAAHSAPMDQLRAEYGLPTLGRDLLRMYTDADWILYSDTPEMVPTSSLPATHRYLGPVIWSPSIDLPDWWGALPTDRPVIYLTLGSSGSSKLLTACLEALANEPVTLLVAAVGAKVAAPKNAFAADFLPGENAAKRADLVICNGGSPTSHQALAAGTPVLGLPSNMDQHLNMHYVTAAGAGESLRSERVTADSVRVHVNKILENPSYLTAARQVRDSFMRYEFAKRFRSLLDEIVTPTLSSH